VPTKSSKQMTPPTPPALLPENQPPCHECGCKKLGMHTFAKRKPGVVAFGCTRCGVVVYQVREVWAITETQP
jgi:hypothetical protein